MPEPSAESAVGGLACRVEAGETPCLVVGLEPGQSVVAYPAAVLWREPSVAISRGEGETVVLRGPGRAALARHSGGTVFAMPLAAGDVVQLAGAQMLVAFGAAVSAERVKGLGDRLTGGDGFRLDRVTAGGQGGVVWVHAAGCVFERGLIDGEMFDVRVAGFLCKDSGVGLEHVFPLQGAGTEFDLVMLRCTGPGRIALQTGQIVPPQAAAAAPPARRGLLGRR